MLHFHSLALSAFRYLCEWRSDNGANLYSANRAGGELLGALSAAAQVTARHQNHLHERVHTDSTTQIFRFCEPSEVLCSSCSYSYWWGNWGSVWMKWIRLRWIGIHDSSWRDSLWESIWTIYFCRQSIILRLGLRIIPDFYNSTYNSKLQQNVVIYKRPSKFLKI